MRTLPILLVFLFPPPLLTQDWQPFETGCVGMKPAAGVRVGTPLASSTGICFDPAAAPSLAAPAELLAYGDLLVLGPHPANQVLSFGSLTSAYREQGRPLVAAALPDDADYGAENPQANKDVALEYKETIVVTADRLPDAARPTPFSQISLGEADLRESPQLRLDDVLRNAAPGFSLYRRSSSRVANPSVQGVSLRNVGPNGAGRTLVLLDGIPLNDPFAGWVPWSRVPRVGLREAIINAGGGAGLFGNAALAGMIHLLTAEPSEIATLSNKLRGEVTVGDHNTFDASMNACVATSRVTFSTFVDRFSTSGYPVLRAEQRGPVDGDAGLSSWVWNSRLDWRVGASTGVTLTAGGFEEDRHDGTQYTRNSNRGQDLSISFDRRFPTVGAALRLQSYAQRRHFDSTFSSINAMRTIETPAVDQYAVPATAAGGSAVWEQQIGSHLVNVGADVRLIEGETRERFRFVDGGFTRDRQAGGQQLFTGAFLEERWQVTPAVELVVGGRLDYWRQSGGHRRERDVATGATLQNVRPDGDAGVSPNGRIGVSVGLNEHMRTRVAVYTGFRAPTLNELYRPFRIGNDITEANSALHPERLYGGEVGLDSQPDDQFRYSISGFYNQLRDAVGNVTIGVGPGTFELAGFVPAGVVLRQRRNLDRVDVLGLETGITWQPVPSWRLRAQYLYTDNTVERADEAPELEGKLLPQSPQQMVVGSLEWTGKHLRLATQGRYSGMQFEDDLNALPLAAFFVVDASAEYTWNDHVSATVRVENLFDAEFDIGKSASGVVRTSAPRLVSLTLSFR